MKSHTRVVVIGGGVVGASVLYHLTKFGWTDIMLIERSELTSGSTWHAAGGFHNLNADTNMASLQAYTIGLYKELEEISGQSCGLHHVGGLTLTGTPERWDYLKAERAKHRYMGLHTELVGPAEIRKLSPITNTDGIIGALYDPMDGHLDPSGTTHAYAKAATLAGAEIMLRNPVLATNPRPDGSWEVVTEQGSIIAEHVVNAGGLWAREVGKMAGVYLPLHPMEHQYLVTEDTPEVYERDQELPHVMDPEGESYLRQEGRGVCIGFYEQNCDAWAVDDNLDRIEDSIAFAAKRFPILQTTGVKQVINGPFTFASDGNPLVGPVPGLRNYWSACGVMAGFSQGGGVGLTLAEWMVEGEPTRDVFAMDVARFGSWITPGYTRAKVRENYQRRFSVSYPNEELPAARPFQTTPAYGIWKEQRAVFGAGYGMEAVNYFALPGDPLYETPSFRRSNAFTAVGQECHAVRTAVGINEIHNFGKYEVRGPGALAFLDRVMAGRLPKVGRLTLSAMLSPKGKLIGDFTISRLGEEHFQLTASFGAQNYHLRWFWQQQPAEGVSIKNVSLQRIGFQIAGPKSRELLSRVTRQDVSNQALPFAAIRKMEIGLCNATVQRVSYTGDLGYEIYVDAENQRALYDTLAQAGEDLGLRPFGMRAMMSLRLEKSFGSWMREFKPDYTPLETGLDRFVAYNKQADFIGKAAALKEKAEGVRRKLCTFVLDIPKGPGHADVVADEPIYVDGEVVGFVTSGGYAHWAEKAVALGFLPVEMIAEGREIEIELLGEMIKGHLITEVLFDPQAARMRG